MTGGKLSEDRVDLSVRRLLREQFQLGLFENPYVDPNRAGYLVGNRAFQKKAEIAQRKSIVLLQNSAGVLPLKAQSETDSIQIYTMGMNPEVVRDTLWSGYVVVAGDYDSSKGETRPAVPKGTDYAILRVVVSNPRSRERRFGGANPDELDLLAFSDMAKAKSWSISPSLIDIQGVLQEVGTDKTILAIRFRQPYELDQHSGLRKAGVILATFGVSDAAILDILTGKFKPSGKLPFALAKNAKAIAKQDPDAPGYDKADTLFPFGHGLSY